MNFGQRRRRIYFHLFGADGELKRLAMSNRTTLDVGCSDGRGSERLTGAAGCDIHLPTLRIAAREGRRRHAVVADARRLPYRAGAFETVVALDVIEHFEKADALAVLIEMQRVARVQVALLTPSGFVEQPPGEDEPWQEHRCGFTADELEALGYFVVGVGGAASVRKAYGAFRVGPIGKLVGMVTTRLLRGRPNLAFHLFAHRVAPQ